MEREQRCQFGKWAGRLLEDYNEEEDDAVVGPKAVIVLDWPDCLEDVFALVSSVCKAYPPLLRGILVRSRGGDEAGRGGGSRRRVTLLSSRRFGQSIN